MVMLATILTLLMMVVLPRVSVGAGQWVKDPNNPILSPTPGAWDAFDIRLPRVLYDGTTFRMWYIGYRSEQSGASIGYATSPDGVKWTKYPDPVLQPGPSGAWDTYTVTLGSVVWNGSLYLMWYRGRGPVAEKGAVGLATSPDGISWTKYAGNPVMKGSTQYDISYPYVIKVDGTYKMWYCEGSTEGYRMHYASSVDGIKWTKYSSAVLTPSSDTKAWDAGSVYSPTVVYDGSTYWMWYSAADESVKIWLIGYATSGDGISWTKYSGNPILSQGPSGAWDSYDSLDNQGVVLVGTSVMLYYSADQVVDGKMVSYKIGLARPPEGFAVPEMPSQTLSLFLGVLVLTATMFVWRRRS